MSTIETITRFEKKNADGFADYTTTWILDTGDTISSAVVSTVTSGISFTKKTFANSTVVINASGGTNGEVYYGNVFAITAGGRKFKREFVLEVGGVG